MGEQVVTTKQQTLKDLKNALRLCDGCIKYYNEMLVEYNKCEEKLYPEVEYYENLLITEKLKADAISQAIYCLEHNVVR